MKNNQYFLMKSKLDTDYCLFQFIGINVDEASCYNIQIREVSTGSDSLVELEWFAQRSIKPIPQHRELPTDKKYELSIAWKLMDSTVRGGNYYSSITDLIQAYEKAAGESVKYIGLSCEYSNILDYRFREQIAKHESERILASFQEAGHDIFEMSAGTLFLKGGQAS